jgi:hypothetical protein
VRASHVGCRRPHATAAPRLGIGRLAALALSTAASSLNTRAIDGGLDEAASTIDVSDAHAGGSNRNW